MEWLVGFCMGVTVITVLVILIGPDKNVTCETFPKNPQPGLFDTFHGETCSDDFGVKNIAKNFNQCIKSQYEQECLTQQYEYFRSSGASEDDAAKALLLVL